MQSSSSRVFSIFRNVAAIIFSRVIAKKPAKMVKFTYNWRFSLIKSAENRFFQQDVQRNPVEVAAKMAVVLGYSGVIFLRGGHLSCHFLRKAPRACQSDFKYQNKNNCKGKMFQLTRQAARFSGINKIEKLASPHVLDFLVTYFRIQFGMKN